MNARMPELKRCFEAAGFTNVKTLLSSGNVVFDARSTSEAALARKAEAAMTEHLGRTFHTIVRSVKVLQGLIDADPYSRFRLRRNSKRLITFLREPSDPTKLSLPLKFDDARILAMNGREIFSAYVPSPRAPAFMAFIERTFGKNVTTRTLDTVKKCIMA
jgi:uncharacterized protein (DUF1697 family)